MGNRAVIMNYVSEEETEESFNKNSMKFRKNSNDQLGVYMHWEGSPFKVAGLLFYCKIKGIRSTNEDSYGWARLCQVIGNYMGDTLSLGIGLVDTLDCNNWDNGTYLIENWHVVKRYYSVGNENEEVWFKTDEEGNRVENWEMLELLYEINERQPESERLDKKYIKREFESNYLPF